MRKTLSALAFVVGCASQSGSADNPFTQNMDDPGKEDSAYMNPDGIEVEVDLEGDVTGPADQLVDAPAQLGQFATTVFRKANTMYIESLAEDASTKGRAEWLVGGTWYTADKVPTGSTLNHWRLRGLDTVMLFAAAKNVKVGDVLTAKPPVSPFTVYTDAGKSCADGDDHIGLDQTVYWYRWEPAQTSCKIPMQDLKVTVSKIAATATSSVYPEFDQLVADKKVTFVVMFGEIDDGPITASETGMRNMATFASNLAGAGFK